MQCNPENLVQKCAMPKREHFSVKQNNWLCRFTLRAINLHQEEAFEVNRIQTSPLVLFFFFLLPHSLFCNTPRGLPLLVFIKALVTE